MDSSLQITISVSDPKKITKILDILNEHSSNDTEFKDTAEEIKQEQEEEQEILINEGIPEEFKLKPIEPENNCILLKIPEVDAAGVEYDPETHSRGKSKLKNGNWKKRRNQGPLAPPPPAQESENSITYDEFMLEIEAKKIPYHNISSKIT